MLPGSRLGAVVEARALAAASYGLTLRNVLLALGFDATDVLASLSGLVHPMWATPYADVHGAPVVPALELELAHLRQHALAHGRHVGPPALIPAPYQIPGICTVAHIYATINLQRGFSEILGTGPGRTSLVPENKSPHKTGG